MADALGAGAERSKMPGDGVNLIPRPEALDSVIGSSSIASITPLAASGGSPREYRVAADGGSGEHYLVINVPDLTPGPYTLSLQVREDGVSRLVLQLMDGADGGLADYLLPVGNSLITRLGRGDKLNATVRRVQGGWLQLSLTSTLTTRTGHVFLQLANSGGSRSFRPEGESATIRAMKLERGETATPYPGTD
jgi:hypothetical protein